MNLFNLFKQHLKLDELLEKAIKKPAYRIDFYKRILNEELVVVVNNNKQEGLSIIPLSDGRIPVFTEKEKIYDNGIIKGKCEFVSIKAKELFGLAKGASFILNPYSKYNKELTPEEIEILLEGNIIDLLRADKIAVNENVIIGQPAKSPEEMISALNVFFAQRDEVQSAYIGWIYSLDTKESPHYILGIKTSGNIDEINYEAGRIVARFLSSGEFADFINMDTCGKIVSYLKSTRPFYQKQH